MSNMSVSLYLLTLLVTTVSCSEGGTFQDIHPPSELNFTSVNVNHVLSWNYPSEPHENETLLFDVQVNQIHETGHWETECEGIAERHCDVVKSIHQYDEGCPELEYAGGFQGRVRACILNANSTTRCSEWSRISDVLHIPSDDKLSPPNFELDGVFNATKLVIRNAPHVVKHLNKSLNCYHDNKLFYEIKFWESKDTGQLIQEDTASFEMETIALRLLQEPQANTEVCVEMRLLHKVLLEGSKWKTKCLIYTHEAEYGLSPVAKAIIYSCCVGVGLLIIICLLLKIGRLYQSVYKEKVDIPKDLMDIMLDSQVNVTDEYNELHKQQNCSVTITRKSSIDNAQKFHSSEIIHSLSPAEMTSYLLQDPEPGNDIKRERKDNTVSPTDHYIVTMESGSLLSDTDSIPYIYSIDYRDERNEATASPTLSTSMKILNELKSKEEKQPNEEEKSCWNRYGSEKRKKVVDSNVLPVLQSPHSPPQHAGLVKIFDIHDATLPDGADMRHLLFSRSPPGELTATSVNEIISSSNLAAITDRQADSTDIRSINNPTYNSQPEIFDCLGEPDALSHEDRGKAAPARKSFHGGDSEMSSSRSFLSGMCDFRERTVIASLGLRRCGISPQPILLPGSVMSPSCSKDNAVVCDNDDFLSKKGRRKATYSIDKASYIRVKNVWGEKSWSSPGGTICHTISPIRDRIVSEDSGYQIESLSLSDDCFSISPPISPTESLFPDVFDESAVPEDNILGCRKTPALFTTKNIPKRSFAYTWRSESRDLTECRPPYNSAVQSRPCCTEETILENDWREGNGAIDVPHMSSNNLAPEDTYVGYVDA